MYTSGETLGRSSWTFGIIEDTSKNNFTTYLEASEAQRAYIVHLLFLYKRYSKLNPQIPLLPLPHSPKTLAGLPTFVIYERYGHPS